MLDLPAPDSIVANDAPRTWLVLGEKNGDNAQVQRLAAALGWPCEVRRLRMRPEWVLGKPPVQPSLAHVDLARSDRLEPPWPDLVITVGRRLSSAGLWIRQQSGGRARLVLIGKPRRHLRRFDLIVASSEYRVARRSNLVRISLPLLRVDTEAVAAAAAAWRPRLAALPRPLIALLVGGPTKALSFDAAIARDIAERTARAAAAAGGSVYVCTSRRTSAPLIDALAAGLPPGTPLYRWREDDPENPYLALLGTADRFVTTSDSVAMMSEVVQLGHALATARLPSRHPWLRALSRSRDLDAPVRALLAERLAVELGEPWIPPAGAPRDELADVAARVRALFTSSRSAAGSAAR
jgi:mitochondrial fission protein ELM1